MRRLPALLGIAAVACAPAIHADPTDDPKLDATFLDALQRAGITFSNGQSAVTAAKTACGMLDHGQAEMDVIHNVTEQNPGISTTSAAQFTAIAASAYCPQHLQRAGGSGGGQN